MKHWTGAAVIAGTLALSGGTFAQQERPQEQPPGQEQEQRRPKPGQQSQKKGEFDLRFLDMTAMHHERGVKMAELAEDKAENPELKNKAKEIAKRQREELEQIDQLRSRLYPDAPKRERMGEMARGDRPMEGTGGQAGETRGTAGRAGGKGGGSMAEMDRLQNLQGAEFDRAFAKAMIQHHQMQVRSSQRALKQARHDEVRQFAQSAVTSQKKEIGDLQQFAGTAKQKQQ